MKYLYHYCFRSNQTISSVFTSIFTETSKHKRSASHGSSLVSWGPRKTRNARFKSCPRLSHGHRLTYSKHFYHWNFLGFMILWINSWCYCYYPQKSHRPSTEVYCRCSRAKIQKILESYSLFDEKTEN